MALLKTKLNIPPPRSNLVSRSRLLHRLDEALLLNHPLTLVSAKAGAGKTTLVSEWLHRQERAAAWLALDANDNDPRRFFSYFVAALQRVGVTISPALSGQMEATPLPPAAALLAEIINEISTDVAPFTLVCDDYHLIDNAWIHTAVEFLVAHRPAAMHLILITRVDPPLPLARLRGRGQVTEIRDDDLRFTAAEAGYFLNEVMQLNLAQDALATLDARTEGWIVGLQMAAISLRGRQRAGDLAAFITAFGGTNRYILDYLMEEVLQQQPPTVQRFLLETSILERMCAPLCDAVRGSAGGGGAPESESQAILVHLERTNLFLVPLDEKRRWYRYHHLFADLLQSTLRQQRTVEDVRALHRRASRWHRGNGSLEEAMVHAIAAADYEAAAALIDANIVSMLSRSEGPVLLSWIEKLPGEVTLGRPWINVFRAYTLALSGRPGEADPLLDEAEEGIDANTPRVAELRGHIAAIRAYTANLWGKTTRVMTMAALAEELLPADHLIARGMSTYALTVTYVAHDDMENAARTATAMLAIGKKLDRLLMIVTALCDLAFTKKVQGQLHAAADIYERTRRWLVQRNGLDSRVRCPYETGRADLLYEWNRLDAAYEHARTGIDYCLRYDVPTELVSGYLTLMRVLQAQGDDQGAIATLRAAEQVVQTQHIRLATQHELQAARVVQWLALGDVAAANRSAAACDDSSEVSQLALVRLYLAQGDPDAAQHLLARQQQAAASGGRTGRLLAGLALQALALEAQEQPDDAETTLARALALARAEGYVRLFLDLGPALSPLLARLAAAGRTLESGDTPGGRHVSAYARALLLAAPQPVAAPDSAPPVATAGPTIPEPEPLTPRESDVLALLATGLSNREIGDRLVVAPSTVKQHLKNIYGKLDVHSRTQAVARARELGLL